MRGFLICVLFVAAATGAVSTGDATDEDAANGQASGTRFAADGIAAWSVDGGGAESRGGGFVVTATLGQPDAGAVAQGVILLDGGLWAGAVNLQCIFCDGFEEGGTGSWSSVVGESRGEQP